MVNVQYTPSYGNSIGNLVMKIPPGDEFDEFEVASLRYPSGAASLFKGTFIGNLPVSMENAKKT